MAHTHLKKRLSSSQLQSGLPHDPSDCNASSHSSQRSLASFSNELDAQSKQICVVPWLRYGHTPQLPNPAGCGREATGSGQLECELLTAGGELLDLLWRAQSGQHVVDRRDLDSAAILDVFLRP